MKIRVAKSQAKRILDARIAKGKQLREEGAQSLQATNVSQDLRTRYRDFFETQYRHWCDTTEQRLSEIFVSGDCPREFSHKHSSEREYVSPDWVPGIHYYIEHQITPQLDYLNILRQNIDEFEECTHDEMSIGPPPASAPEPELPARVTLSWLWRHVPVSFWLWFVGLLIISFVIGVVVGQVPGVESVIQTLISLTSR